MAKIKLDQKASNKITNLLNQLPISCTWIVGEIIEVLNTNEIQDDKDEEKATD